ncbi:MAG: hypothetical protein H6748_09240 [Spirochaetaceae bacterium]|nr:hypothetical protein [Spirochaetaceae bacterium]
MNRRTRREGSSGLRLALACAMALAIGAPIAGDAGRALAESAPEAPAPEVPAQPVEPVEYDVVFDVGIVPSEKSAHVRIDLSPAGGKVVRWIRFSFDPLRYRAIEASGKLEEVEGGMLWTPPERGGFLRYVFDIDHLRGDRTYDSRCAKKWAILRGEDLVPRTRISTADGATSKSVLRLRLPEGWSAAVPYESVGRGRYALDNERTNFDRPGGWFAFGKLGVLRERISGTQIAVAGPAGQGVRRMDLLAMLKWTLPSVKEVFGELPDRLQLVVAGDPMWRGGLSGPNSLYLHAGLPLIASDGSSAPLHEIMHTIMHARSGDGGQWIVEGIAEYYSIALLRRSGTITARRYQRAIDGVRKRAQPESASLSTPMNGALRARAVLLMMEVDDLVRDATAGAKSLDDVVRSLRSADDVVTPEHFRRTVARVAGRDLDAFFDRLRR